MKVKGHLSEYPLRELLSILRNRRETGRLQVNFERVPGIFHLKEGRILDAAIGPIKGLDAVRVAVSMKAAAFDFDDTVGIAVEATINETDHRQIVTLLLGPLPQDDEDFESIPWNVTSPVRSQDVGPAVTTGLAFSGNIQARLLSTARQTLIYARRHTFAVSFAGILMLLVPIVIAMAVNVARNDGPPRAAILLPDSDHHRENAPNPEGGRANQGNRSPLPNNAADTGQKPIASPEPTGRVSSSSARQQLSPEREAALRNEDAHPLRNENALPKKASSKVIAVVIQIEQGRITEAYVKDHHPGLGAFEATAIRLARQRRYSRDTVGSETIFVTVSEDQ